MPTFQLTCTNCGKDKWPTLPSRPEAYVCILCQMVEGQPKSRQASAKASAARSARQGGRFARKG